MNDSKQNKPLYSKDRINRIFNRGSKLERFIMYLNHNHINTRLDNINPFLSREEEEKLKYYIDINKKNFIQ